MKLPVNYTKLSIPEKKKVKEEYIKRQKGLCYWCKEPLTKTPERVNKKPDIDWDLFPPNFLKHPVHLQHCHKTGMTEGAVHAYCNAVMWFYYGR